MAYSYKVLGQAMSGANANVDLYTVPASTSAIISTVNVCNQSASNVTLWQDSVAVSKILL
jgi:hypothetical protein